MRPIQQLQGFSLVEAIMAVGIFAGTVAVTIGLMATLSRQAAVSMETLAAQRLPDAIRVELARLAASGFDNLAAQVPIMSAPLDGGYALIASRDALGVESLEYLPTATSRIAPEECYYLVECWRFPAEPLAYHPSKAFLALHVRISWPYRLPGMATPVPVADRSQLAFAVSLNR